MYAWYYKVRWYAGIALGLCLLVTLMKYSAWIEHRFLGKSRQPSNVVQQPVQPGGQFTGSTQPAAAPLMPADILTQVSQAKSLLKEASANTSEALKHALTWQIDVEPLRDQVLVEPAATGAGGERGETDEVSKLLERLGYVLRRERTSPQELRDAATRIESLQLKVNDHLKQSSPSVRSPIDITDISQLHAMCKQAKVDWHRDLQQALAIKYLLEQQSKPLTNPAGPTTIGSIMEGADATAAIADLDTQIIREKEEETARRKREAELEEQRRQKEAAEAEMLAEATSPEVKALLFPFLELRTIQPSLSGTFSIKWVRTYDKQPMSFGKLMEIGALDDTVLGLQKLALVGGNRNLPEPKWSIASQPNNWSTEDEDRLKRAQQMLRDYGPILVKARWLSE